MSDPSHKIAIIIYSLYGHVADCNRKKGIESAGGSAEIFMIYRVPETLTPDVLEKVRAPPKRGYPTAERDTLKEYNAFLFGIPTRYGNMPAQVKSYWDATGHLWVTGALYGKYAGRGQETTALTFLTTLVHQGIAVNQLSTLDEPHGGSPWGAGTFAAPDGSRHPSALELEIAEIQGRNFIRLLQKFGFERLSAFVSAVGLKVARKWKSNEGDL
ncbi:flavoprotein-like protein [Cyathus striatus]|nr:flavoprotein-like protein [Cyathus striatus]